MQYVPFSLTGIRFFISVTNCSSELFPFRPTEEKKPLPEFPFLKPVRLLQQSPPPIPPRLQSRQAGCCLSFFFDSDVVFLFHKN